MSAVEAAFSSRFLRSELRLISVRRRNQVGLAALAAVPVFRPQIVLLDIGMPQMDGYEVARRIRRQWPSEELQLIAVTGWGQEEDRRRTRETGFDLHMVKPVNVDALKGLLADPGGEMAIAEQTGRVEMEGGGSG